MGKKDEDEIPLLEAAEIVDRRRFRKTPENESVATIRYTVKADETMEVCFMTKAWQIINSMSFEFGQKLPSDRKF